MSRPDPSDRPSDLPPKPPEADGAPPHPKRGASKANDVAQAIWGTPKMMSPRTMAMMETAMMDQMLDDEFNHSPFD